jgi:hypothetical protein
MAWTYDADKVGSQWDEFRAFLDQARGDQPAGPGDLLGRPFRHPADDQPDVTLQPQPRPEPNYYLLQAAQLYEAGLINQQQYTTITNNIYM